MCDKFESLDVMFYNAKCTAKNEFGLKKDDKIIITGGLTNGRSGNTNILKIETI